MTLSPRTSTSPDSPGSDVGARRVDDAHLEPRPGPAHRGGDGLGVVVVRRRAGGAALGEAVPGDDLREGQLVVDPADQLDRDVGGAGHRDPQGREVVGGRGRGGRGSPGRASGARAGRSRARRRPGTARGPRRTPARAAWWRRPATEARIPALRPNMWKYGIHHQVDVARREPGHRHPVGGDAQRAAVGHHDALGQPGRARGEEDVGRVVRARVRRCAGRPRRAESGRRPGQKLRPGHRTGRWRRPGPTTTVVERRQLDARALEHGHVVVPEEVGDGDHCAGSAPLQQLGRLGTLEPRVDRDEHPAG